MAKSADHLTYRFGSFALDLERGMLLAADNKEILLRPKSFALLRMLVENAGRLLSREAIMDALWPGLFVTDDNVTQCIHDIRRALEPESSRMLRTVPRRGYIFAAEVMTKEPPLRDERPRSAEIGFGRSDDDGPSGSQSRMRRDVQQTLASRQQNVRRPPRLSVFVASLRNLSAAGEYASLVEGITDDITTDLSRFSGCFVVGRAEAVLDEYSSGRDIARNLGVNYLVQGSIRATADLINVNVQLVDVETGGHLWADRFDVEYDHGIATRNEVTGRLVRTLSLKLIEDVNRRIEALPPSEWTLDDLLMRGRAMLSRPLSEANRRNAMECFEQALITEPESIDARMGIVWVLVANVSDGWSRSFEQDLARAERLLIEVIRVDANLTSSHGIMGVLRRFQGRLEESKIELEIAIDLAPNNAVAIGQLGLTLTMLGQPEAAIPQLERSLRLAPNDPYAPGNNCILALCHLLLSHTEAAIVCLTKAKAGNPGLFYVHLLLAAAFGLRGDLGEARAALMQAAEIRPETGSESGLRVLFRQGTPSFIAQYDKTVRIGLERAGLPDATW